MKNKPSPVWYDISTVTVQITLETHLSELSSLEYHLVQNARPHQIDGTPEVQAVMEVQNTRFVLQKGEEVPCPVCGEFPVWQMADDYAGFYLYHGYNDACTVEFISKIYNFTSMPYSEWINFVRNHPVTRQNYDDQQRQIESIKAQIRGLESKLKELEG